jgi:hypothetical protein
MIKSGDDPLKENRQALITSEAYFPLEGVALEIKEINKREYSRRTAILRFCDDL